MSGNRKPAAFKLDAQQTASRPKKKPAAKKARKPVAIPESDSIEFIEAAHDPFDPGALPAETEPARPPLNRRFRLGAIFLSATGILLTMAAGLWVEGLISDFFARSQWLGWVAAGVASIAGLAFLFLLFREVAALVRLRSVEALRTRATEALSGNDLRHSRKLVADLKEFTASNPMTAKGRNALDLLKEDVLDAADLLSIAEKELFAGLDEQAKGLILQSAKRVSIVTAISPRALVDIGYVLFESGRLIRSISELYGGRPGFLGFLKLVRNVAAHLAVTGSIAVGDSLAQQIIGHGLAARLSARLGEGVVNGLMTVRIGIAAMVTARPLPFVARKRPGMGEFLSAITGTSVADKDK